MRLRMRTAMQRMSRVGLAPTNLEIAKALGVPKGTVDSGLYWLKRKLASVYDPSQPRGRIMIRDLTCRAIGETILSSESLLFVGQLVTSANTSGTKKSREEEACREFKSALWQSRSR